MHAIKVQLLVSDLAECGERIVFSRLSFDKHSCPAAVHYSVVIIITSHFANTDMDM